MRIATPPLLGPNILRVFESHVDSGNVGAGAQDLTVFGLGANQLAAIGNGVRFTAWGFITSNANAKTITTKFGVLILSIVPSINITGTWRASLTAIKSGASTQRICGDIRVDNQISGAVDKVITGSFNNAADDTQPITIGMNATGVANNDVVCKGLLAEFF